MEDLPKDADDVPAESRADLPPDPSAVLSAALAEFNKLRDEIANRSNSLWTLMGLNATICTTVAGFVLAQKADPRLLLVLPLLTPALGLLVIDHAANITNIGEYVNSEIRPLVLAVSREPRLLAYEEFVNRWETRPVRRMLAFGLPLVLLFSVVPVYALVLTAPLLGSPALWMLWLTGLAVTAFQVAMWMALLVPPLRRSIGGGPV